MLSRRRVLGALAAGPLLHGCAALLPTPTAVPAPTPTAVPTPTPVVETTITVFHETHTHGELVRKDGLRFEHYVGLLDALRSGPSLFLGNGDDLGALHNGKPTQGRHAVAAFNAAGLDADTIGFNELDLDPEVFRQRVGECRFPWVSANVREASGGGAYGQAAGVRPWAITEVGGIAVGLTGYLVSAARLPTGMRQHVAVVDAADALRGAVAELRYRGAQVVLVLDHGSHEETLQLAESVEGIDAFLGTHVGPILDQPRVVKDTLVSVAGWDMQRLGELRLTVRRGRVVGHSYRHHTPSPSGPVNQAVAQALAPFA